MFKNLVSFNAPDFCRIAYTTVLNGESFSLNKEVENLFLEKHKIDHLLKNLDGFLNFCNDFDLLYAPFIKDGEIWVVKYDNYWHFHETTEEQVTALPSRNDKVFLLIK